MRTGTALAILAGAVAALVAVPAQAQSVVCCGAEVDVGGAWEGAVPHRHCQSYLDTAPPEILRRMCSRRSELNCLDTMRCGDVPGGRVTLEPDALVASLERAVGGAPPGADRAGRVLLPKNARPGKQTRFTVWLDDAGCALPAAGFAEDPPRDAKGAAKRVLLGLVAPGGGGVRVQLRLRDLATGAMTPATGEAPGGGPSAVLSATRLALDRLQVTCGR